MCSNVADGPNALAEAIEELSQQVKVLTQAVDELTDQLEWINNNRIATCTRSPALRVRSMSKDPASANWQVNQTKPEDLPPPQREAASTLFD